MSQQYLVSIGMPVRNEERFLHQALDSLLVQTHTNVEIIISDNASTDNTPEIAREYAAKHPAKIRYHGFEQNIGASANFSWVREQARGKYFMWAAGHDQWDANYLQACLSALESNAEAMIAFGTTRWIDEHGAPFGLQTGWTDTRGMSVIARYFCVFWGNMNPILGMMRTEVIKSLEFNDMVGVDLAVLLELALRGDVVHCTGTAWSRREFRHETNYKEKLQRYRSTDYALSTSFMGKYFPLARLPMRILGDLWRSDASVGTRFLISAVLSAALPAKYLTDKHRKKSATRATTKDPV